MKVCTAFQFDETQLRTVRAAHGRGGKATREECRTFIDRAIRTALDDAPTPKPARVKREKPTPVAPVVRDERKERDRIARAYGHGVPSGKGVARA